MKTLINLLLSLTLFIATPTIKGADFMVKPTGWNTWDARCINAWVHLPEALEIRLALFDPQTSEFIEEFRWAGLHRLGAHAPDGSYSYVELKHKNLKFALETASEPDRWLAKITPLTPASDEKLVAQVFFNWNQPGQITQLPNNFISAATNHTKFTIRSPSPQADPTAIPSKHKFIAFKFTQPVLVACVSGEACFHKELEEFINTKRQQYLNQRVTSTAGWLKDCPQAIIQAVVWNTIWEPINNKICSPVSREWAVDWGGYALFDWDIFFCAILAALEDKELAYHNIRAILDEVTDECFVPNFACPAGKSTDRSQPPVGSYCVLKVYKRFGEKQILEQTFTKLLRWHNWWLKARDGNHDGLLEWGSHPHPNAIGENNTAQAAKYESGLDNSPIYDDVEFDKTTHTMKLTDVGLNALYALDTWALAEIAQELGEKDQANKLKAEYQQLKQRINQQLWSEEHGIYLNKTWAGKFSTRLSPTNFYPLIAGLANPQQAQRMVKEHLLNEKEFWGQYIIPSIARNDTAFPDQNYWRGRIWGPMNFLVCEGLRRYEYDEIAHQFSRRSLNLFLKEWTQKSHIHENYNAETGEGDDVTNSDPLYHWGALLAYLAVQELIDVESWGELKFGNLSTDEAAIKNITIAGDTYNVKVGKQLIVTRNNQTIIKTDQPVIIHNWLRTPQQIQCNIKATGEINLTLPSLPTNQKIQLTLNNQISYHHTDKTGQLTIKLTPPAKLKLRLL